MLAEVTLQVEGGEIQKWCPRPMTVVVGPNGAGKSTLLREVERWFQGNRDTRFVRGLRLDVRSRGGRFARVEFVEELQNGAIKLRDFLQIFGLSVTAELAAEWALKLSEGGGKVLESISGTESPSALMDLARHFVLPELKGLDPQVLEAWGPVVEKQIESRVRHTPYQRMLRSLPDLKRAAALLHEDIATRLRQLGFGEPEPAKKGTRKGRRAGKRAAGKHDEAADPDGRLRQVAGAISEALLDSELLDASQRFTAVRQLVMRLDGTGRIGFLEDEGVVRALFDHPPMLNELRARALEGFCFHLGLDCSQLLTGQAGGLRLVTTDQKAGEYELRLDPRAREFFARARPLADQGDGVRAFLGLSTANAFFREGLVLVDEPEAFLHPPLARSLARLLANEAEKNGATCICATHSAHFLSGCLDAAHPVHILRIAYDRVAGRRSLHLIPADQLSALMADPMVRSAGVLDTLFAEAAILCEGEGDCLFYRTAFEAVSKGTSSQPVFVSMDSKSKVAEVLGVLHRVGVRVATILDFDLILGGSGKNVELKAILEAREVPEGIRESITTLAARIRGRLAEEAKKEAKHRGRGAFRGPQGAEVEALLRDLGEWGIFIVPCGELESWRPFDGPHELPPSTEKRRWAIEAARGISAGWPLGAELRAFVARTNSWLQSAPSDSGLQAKQGEPTADSAVPRPTRGKRPPKRSAVTFSGQSAT